MDYIEENNLFYYAHQYGFRRKMCTQDAVPHLHDHILSTYEYKRNITGAMYIDL